MAKEFRVYRANKTGTGVAVAFQLSYKEHEKFDKHMLFMTLAKQLPGEANEENATFSWKENAINVKLGEADLSEMLSVLYGRQAAAGYNGSLFHETPGGGNKVVKFSAGDKGVYLNVSMQDKAGAKVGPYSLVLSHGEGCSLKVLLEEAVKKIYGW